MTGTPVANRPYDIWAQIYFLDSGESLGRSYRNFKEKYELPADIFNGRNDEYEESLADIYHAIRSFSVRETKQTAGLELPDKRLINLEVNMEEEQEKIYVQYQHDLSAEVLRDGKLTIDNVDQILKRLLRLVQVASNPSLVDESYTRCPGKITVLKKIISSIGEREKLIVWTNFVKNANYICKLLVSFGALKVHGKMAIFDRNRSIDKFIEDPNYRILVATPGAAKEGLTLTVANYAVFYDRNFSLNDWLQAQDRIHRVSQSKDCYVFHLIANNSIDLWIDQLLEYKQQLARQVVNDLITDDTLTNIKGDFESVIGEILQT